MEKESMFGVMELHTKDSGKMIMQMDMGFLGIREEYSKACFQMTNYLKENILPLIVHKSTKDNLITKSTKVKEDFKRKDCTFTKANFSITSNTAKES